MSIGSTGGGGTTGGVTGSCPFPIDLRAPVGISVYAMLFAYDASNALYIFNVTLGIWQTIADFNSGGGVSGYSYSYGTLPLTENPDMGGNYNGSITPFSIGDGHNSFGGSMYIEYWQQTGGSPYRPSDVPLGTQYGYWDDLTCQWFDSKEAYDEWKATHGVQTGDNSNDGLAEASCCDKIDEMLDMVRVIYAKVHQTDIYKRGK